jgi:hypothetical protein
MLSSGGGPTLNLLHLQCRAEEGVGAKNGWKGKGKQLECPTNLDHGTCTHPLQFQQLNHHQLQVEFP